MEKILRILQEIRPDVDFNLENDLIDGGILDSFDIVCIISELNDAFNIHIRVTDLKPENFNSLEGICRLVESKQNLM
jgi:D-alanine--poly(phosphoribitol) ligase subunit 2